MYIILAEIDLTADTTAVSLIVLPVFRTYYIQQQFNKGA